MNSQRCWPQAIPDFDGDWQAPAAAALDSLAYRSLVHRQEMAAAGVIPPLVAFLQHSLTSPPDPTLPEGADPFAPDQPLRAALNLLHSLALDAPNLRREIAGSGAIPVLTPLLGTPQSGVQGSSMQPVQAAGILRRMAADGQDFRDAIMAAGAIPAVLGMLQGPGAFPAGQEQALGAVEALAANSPACRAAIISAEGVPAVVQMLNANAPHVQRRAAAALTALTVDGANVLPGSLLSGAVQKLTDLVLTPPDPETQVSFGMTHFGGHRA